MPVGAIVRRLLWLAPLAAAAAAQEEPPTVLGQPAGWSVEEATTQVDVVADSALYLGPDHQATVLALLPEGRLPLIESRDNWVKVRFGDRVGWVDLEAPLQPREQAPVRQPTLKLQIAAPTVRIVPPEPEPLELGPGWAREKLGSYTLHTRSHDRRLIEDLGTVARQHARLYAERYGLDVEGEVSGSVVLFGGARAFQEFRRERGHEVFENDSAGYFRSPELVVLHRGSHARRKVAAVLLHELTHLLSYRALRDSGRRGDDLPKWLDEGMANDLSLASFDRRGDLRAQPLGPANLLFGRHLGVLLLRTELRMSAEGTAPSWSSLLAMDEEAFFGGDTELHYLMSSLLVRYLLSDDHPELAAAFRGYLASVAAGGDTRPEELMSRLGLSWVQLSNGFRRWLLRQKVRFGL